MTEKCPGNLGNADVVRRGTGVGGYKQVMAAREPVSYPAAPLPVDVVIPAWGHYLVLARRAMASVPDVARHIVVTDPGAAVTAHGRVALTVVTRPGDSLGAARNAGLARATAQFVVFLDADDEMIPGALAAMVRAARGRPRAHIVFGRFRPPSRVLWPSAGAGRLMTTPLALPLLLSKNTLPMTGTLMRRRAVPADLFPSVRSEDWPAAVRMRARSGAVFIDRAVMEYATHVGSRSRSRITRAEIVATRRALLPAVVRERGAPAFWRAVDRLADRRRRRLDADLSSYDDVAAGPTSDRVFGGADLLTPQ